MAKKIQMISDAFLIKKIGVAFKLRCSLRFFSDLSFTPSQRQFRGHQSHSAPLHPKSDI